MTNQTSDVRLVGTLHDSGDGTGVVRVEDVFDTDIHDLWSAVTEPERLQRWLAVVDGDLKLGGQVHARFTSTWEGDGRVEECDAPHRLLLRWTDSTVLEAELTAEGDRTRLVVRDHGLLVEDLPFHGAGWQAHLEDLGAEIERRPAGDWRSRWTTLTPLYQALVARRD